MSISSTVKKFMPYLKTASGYMLHRLSSQAVEMDDGTTLEAKVTSLNNLISKKLNSANVVNNLTTTNSGYALDARQGKALNDSITSLNSALDARTNSKVRLWVDNEGGNIEITSPNGTKWQMDSYDGSHFRIYNNKNGETNPFYYFSGDNSKGGTVATEQYVKTVISANARIVNTIWGTSMTIPKNPNTQALPHGIVMISGYMAWYMWVSGEQGDYSVISNKFLAGTADDTITFSVDKSSGTATVKTTKTSGIIYIGA